MLKFPKPPHPREVAATSALASFLRGGDPKEDESRVDAFRRARTTFLEAIDAFRPVLVGVLTPRYPHEDVENAVGDVIAGWVQRVMKGEPVVGPRKTWLDRLCRQVRDKLRPRRSRTGAMAPLRFQSYEAMGDVVKDWRVAGPEAGEFAEFLDKRAKEELTPAEYAIFATRLAAVTGRVPGAKAGVTPASERVLISRIRSWLRDVMETA